MRIGIIGLGKIAQTKYLPALHNHTQVCLVALCDQSESLATQLAAHYGLPQSTVSVRVEQVIEKRPDLVFLLTHEHYELTKALLTAGISICVEKPLSWDSQQARELATLAKQHGVFLLPAYMKQYDPAFLAFAHKLREKGLPLTMQVCCYAGNNKRWCDSQYLIYKENSEERIKTKSELKNAWTSFFTQQQVANSASIAYQQTLLQFGIHQINLLHRLFGELSINNCRMEQNQGVVHIAADFQREGTAIHYELLPLFQAPWLWKERYEAVYTDRILVYEPSSPFLTSSESVLREIGYNGLSTEERRYGTGEPFGLMIQAFMQGDWTQTAASEVEGAIRDIELIEAMVSGGAGL